LLAEELLYSPLFLIAVNAALAAGIVLAVRRLRSAANQQVEQVRDPHERLRSAIRAEVRDPSEYVIGVGRALMGELLEIRELGLSRSSTFREALDALASHLGQLDGLDEFAMTFERVRYGGEVPSGEELERYRATALAILEALDRRAPMRPSRAR